MTIGGGGVRQKVILYDKGILGVGHRCLSPSKTGNFVSRAFWNLCDPSLIGFLKRGKGRLDKKRSFVLLLEVG